MFEKNEGRGGFSRVLIASLITSLAVGALLFYLASGYVSRNNPDPGTQSVPQATPQPGQPGGNLQAPLPQQIASQVVTGTPVAQAVARSAMPGVVGITVERVESGNLFDRNAPAQVGVGSGIIASSNGYIITNHHVAGGKSRRITVSLADGRNVDGTTVWSDPVLDLAVVKVNQRDLPTIPLGDANTLQVGETAIAIGNPLGLQFQRTVTSGIISALNRTIQIQTDQGSNYMEDLIQTDASINPGNSGGPLLNARGEVVGVNTIKVASAEAIGFAVPINIVKPILAKYVDKGDFKEAYMGVFAYDKEVIPFMDGNLKIDKGIYVAHVDETGPAYKAGIRQGCIIRQVDGRDINTMMDLRAYMYTKEPGDTIEVSHLMHGENKWTTAAIRLGSKDKDGMVTR